MRKKDEEDPNVTIDHDGVLIERPDSKRFSMADGPVWIPKSQIVDETGDSVTIPRWLAEDRELV